MKTLWKPTLLAVAVMAACSGSVHAICVSGVSTAKPVNPAGKYLGVTRQEIHARLPGILEHNLRTGDANLIAHNLKARELADLAAVYKHAGGDNTLLTLFAKKADAKGLQKLATAFGQRETDAVAKVYAPKAVYEEFVKLPVLERAATSPRVAELLLVSTVQGEEPAPNNDMTPYEIYLEYRTAVLGSLSISSALFETAVYMSTAVSQAFGAGYAVGTGVNYLIETYDPALQEVIGGTLDTMLNQLSSAASELAQGNVEKSLNNLFGEGSPPISYNNAGDFGDLSSMYFEDMGGGGSC